MNEYCMIEVAFDNMEQVNKVADELLAEKLICGVQIIESNSKWLWHGDIEEAKEYLMFIKTKKNLADNIYDIVRKHHSYESFEFAIFPLTSTSTSYLNWINNETRGISKY